MVPIAVRRKIVEAYQQGLSGSFVETAELFGVGEATVNRLIRLHRETGDVLSKPKSGRKRKIDLDWLRRHAEACPSATREDRARDWAEEHGSSIEASTIGRGLRQIGWSYKKNHAHSS
jgi:transposase